MRTIILFIASFAMATGLISCSDSTNDSPDTSPDVVTFKVDGTQKTFTNVQVTESVYIIDDINIPTYNVLATNQDNEGEYIAFQIQQDYTGTAGLYTLIYNDAEGNHTIADNFSMNITSNTNSRLAGAFSGPLFQQEIEPSVNISEGSFDINY
jgi:hypothetical protein